MTQYRVCFAAVVDEKPSYQQRAVMLLATLRALGGEYADADFFLCVAGRLLPEFAPLARKLNARVTPVEAVSAQLPATTKLRFLQMRELREFDYAVLMDADTAIATSPEGMFGGSGVRARVAGGTSVPPAVLADLFARRGLPPQPACYVTAVRQERTPVYFNSGVVVVATGWAERFAESWIRHQTWLLDRPELLPGCANHTNQASLSLALVETGVPLEPLDLGFNFPVHRAPASFFTPAISALAPVVLHYDLLDADGSLVPSHGLGARAAVERVNDAWRSACASVALPATIAGRS